MSLFGLHFHITFHYLGKAGQEIKQDGNPETEAEGDYGGMLLTGLLPLAHSACIFMWCRTTCPEWHYSWRAGPLTSIVNQETAPIDLLTASQMEAFSQSPFPLPRR